jgi:hypothetical protein
MPFGWEVAEQTPDQVTVRLWRAGVATNTTVERWITLGRDRPYYTTRYRLYNGGPQPLDFLWKLHPALRVSSCARIDLPAGTVYPEPPFNARLDNTPFLWPQARGAQGERVDMRAVPPASAATCDFYYATELSAGWCALTQVNAGYGFGLAFDPAVFRSVWVFGAYGGWRGHYTTLLEPCTGYPYRLEDAVARGTASHLEPGAALETTVTTVLYTGCDQVSQITREGQVH